MKDYQYITSSHPSYIENLYHDFKNDPTSVDANLKKFFEGFDYAVDNNLVPSSNGTPQNGTTTATDSDASKSAVPQNLQKEFGVYQLIQAYRNKGHLLAKTNPLKPRKDRHAELELSNFGLDATDLPKEFKAGKYLGINETTLEHILNYLENIYANHVGVEFMYINDSDKVQWILEAVEKRFSTPLSIDERRRTLQKLNEGVMLEKFLHTKYVGQKRFSLEGGEAAIAALDKMIDVAANSDVKEAAIGMAHRGRLNVLANILGKTYEQIFSEFEGNLPTDSSMGSGDVKYHLGFNSDVPTFSNKKIRLKLLANPSHLEAVNPLVEGYCRAKADILYNSDYDKILPILIHGDASLAGQGIIYEVLQMSKLQGYYTGGTIHYVINNQIGFTTDFDDARSTDYCTSIASMVQAPVFHVNGDDPEAVVKVAEIATEYRQKFNSDVFIDMVCYRRHGHNEGDEPKFTQPVMYNIIEKHLNAREIYTQYLMENGEPDARALAKEMEQSFLTELQNRLDEVKQHPLPYTLQQPEIEWASMKKATAADFESSPNTAISENELQALFKSIIEWPADFKPLRKVEKLLFDKEKLLKDEHKIDWATAELLAYASLLNEGKNVRMSGQDVKRGTFSHRHAVLYDATNNQQYNRLNHVNESQTPYRIYNSFLSEYGVLGFEYGYASEDPNSLVVWEAQFGDFVNGAQIILDQFISSAETKWQQMNGITLLLPHGYEGQGPEHSSARLERFLQQCAELNMVITNITTAANIFHLLRRQLTWNFRKPLVNFSPKAYLRHPGTYSDVQKFTNDKFHEVYDDDNLIADSVDAVTKVLLCSGKIYYDLNEKRARDKISNVAIVRLEQLYPLPQNQIDEIVKKYKNAVWYWVQEEPLNMGAASYLNMNLENVSFSIISRQASASPATGYSKIHKKEQEHIVDTAFAI